MRCVIVFLYMPQSLGVGPIFGQSLCRLYVLYVWLSMIPFHSFALALALSISISISISHSPHDDRRQLLRSLVGQVIVVTFVVSVL